MVDVSSSSPLISTNLVDAKLYVSTSIFLIRQQFDIYYDLSFMDVDKILPSSSTLGWHSVKVKGKVHLLCCHFVFWHWFCTERWWMGLIIDTTIAQFDELCHQGVMKLFHGLHQGVLQRSHSCLQHVNSLCHFWWHRIPWSYASPISYESGRSD